jgi:serine protease inhibitor
MKNYINLSLMIGFLLMTASGFSKTTFEYDKKPSISAKNNLFAFKFYGELIKTEKENVFFSPFSISTALAMTYAGADKTTADEIANTFYFGPNDETFHAEYGEYLKNTFGQFGWEHRTGNSQSFMGRNEYEIFRCFLGFKRTSL